MWDGGHKILKNVLSDIWTAPIAKRQINWIKNQLTITERLGSCKFSSQICLLFLNLKISCKSQWISLSIWGSISAFDLNYSFICMIIINKLFFFCSDQALSFLFIQYLNYSVQMVFYYFLQLHCKVFRISNLSQTLCNLK